MAGLLDAIQAASNTAADTVAGPVDIIAALLRAAGVQVNKPIGGTDWMLEKGLKKPVEQSASRVAGETLGMLSPVVAAAKAPQIAKGLLEAGREWQAYNRALGPAGASQATVWHGSPHKFDKFDSGKIGTGEGAQAYGHGLYLAESPEVAGSYAQSVKSNSGELVKRGAAYGLPNDVASNLAAALQSGKKFDPVLDGARKMVSDPLVSAPQREAAQRLIDNEMAAYNAWSDWSKPGQVYKVDLPDNLIARMLDWDKPLSQQAPEVQKALDHLILDMVKPYKRIEGSSGFWAWIDGQQKMFASKDEAINALRDSYHGSALLSVLSGKPSVAGDANASEVLRRAGVPGIRYLDRGSRAAGKGSYNYVVFPGEEDALTILERNGMPIGR